MTVIEDEKECPSSSGKLAIMVTKLGRLNVNHHSFYRSGNISKKNFETSIESYKKNNRSIH